MFHKIKYIINSILEIICLISYIISLLLIVYLLSYSWRAVIRFYFSLNDVEY